ncbi:MAG TPA: hypothetical protein VGO60_09855 [Iamia sp.]|jgi:hypothetical protein|nr:hypothetical protein [Iamia sp.]
MDAMDPTTSPPRRRGRAIILTLGLVALVMAAAIGLDPDDGARTVAGDGEVPHPVAKEVPTADELWAEALGLLSCLSDGGHSVTAAMPSANGRIIDFGYAGTALDSGAYERCGGFIYEGRSEAFSDRGGAEEQGKLVSRRAAMATCLRTAVGWVPPERAPADATGSIEVGVVTPVDLKILEKVDVVTRCYR